MADGMTTPTDQKALNRMKRAVRPNRVDGRRLVEALESRTFLSANPFASPAMIDGPCCATTVAGESNANSAPAASVSQPQTFQSRSDGDFAVDHPADATPQSGPGESPSSTLFTSGVYWVGDNVVVVSSPGSPVASNGPLDPRDSGWNPGNPNMQPPADPDPDHSNHNLDVEMWQTGPAQGALPPTGTPDGASGMPTKAASDNVPLFPNGGGSGTPLTVGGNIPGIFAYGFPAFPGDGAGFRGLKHPAPLFLRAGLPSEGESLILTPLAQTPTSADHPSLAFMGSPAVVLDPALANVTSPSMVPSTGLSSPRVYAAFGTAVTAIPSAAILSANAPMVSQAVTSLASAAGKAADTLALIGSAESISTAVAYNFVHFNPAEFLNDAAAVFANESASMMPAAQATHSTARAWAVTASVLSLDAAVLGYLYLTAKREKKARAGRVTVTVRPHRTLQRRRPR